MICTQGIDGDKKNFQLARNSSRNNLKRWRAQGRSGGIFAIAILIDAVVRPIARTRVALGIVIIAIATTEEARVAVVIKVSHALTKRQEFAS